MEIKAAISAGELFDKISVLDIKLDNLEDRHYSAHGPSPEARRAIANVEKERALLLDIAEVIWKPGLDRLLADLKRVNLLIWDAVDALHVEDRKWLRNPWKLARLARTIYVENDSRAAIKREINEFLKSEIVEEKLYL